MEKRKSKDETFVGNTNFCCNKYSAGRSYLFYLHILTFIAPCPCSVGLAYIHKLFGFPLNYVIGNT